MFDPTYPQPFYPGEQAVLQTPMEPDERFRVGCSAVKQASLSMGQPGANNFPVQKGVSTLLCWGFQWSAELVHLGVEGRSEGSMASPALSAGQALRVHPSYVVYIL